MRDDYAIDNITIAGSGGGGKGGGSKGSEDPNNLKSRQTAKVVDLISEGPIKGVVGGMKGVFLDGVALRNADGSNNFKNCSTQFVNGYPGQPIMKGFAAQQTDEAVSLQLLQNQPATRSIINTDADRARVTVSTPNLSNIDTGSGDIHGNFIQFRIQLQNNGGGYKTIGNFEIRGKTTTLYQRAISFALPDPGPWDIRVTRTSPDAKASDQNKDLYWDSMTSLIDDRINYAYSACIGSIIDAEQFRSIPKRSYLADGLLMRIPSNYDPYKGSYSGAWDGTFKNDWSCNPAWIFYDLVTKNRYGLGQFVPASMVDKWALYRIGRYCDQRVGRGQRRFTCNVQITSQYEAFDLLRQIASIFRGFYYWSGGLLVAVADMPSDPVMQFTNANVIDGQFTYSGTDIRARHTMAAVSWNDPDLLGETRIAIVEDQEAISRYGIQKIDVPAIGCTNEEQAIRIGKWQLYTEQYEGEAVRFLTGLEAAWAHPGDIIQIMDANISGKRRGGRVASGTSRSRVYFDGLRGAATAGGAIYLSCLISEGKIETKQIVSWTQDYADLLTPFSQAPVLDSVFVINEAGDLEPTLWRVLGAKQAETDQYEIAAVRHYPGKWDYVEKDKAFSLPDITDISTIPKACTELNVQEYLVQTSPISVGVRATFSWRSPEPQFDAYYRRPNDNWTRIRSDQQAIDIPVQEGTWEFQVIAVNAIGKKSPAAKLTKNIKGRFVPPAAPKQFRINVADGVALFDWLPATELDVLIGGHFELRHSARTEGANWISAQTVIPSVPGTATSCETNYQPGTWFLRTYDITGTPSTTWATILVTRADSRYVGWTRLDEQPDWLGQHDQTTIIDPQDWLAIDHTNYPDATEGVYTFYNRLDAGGVFPIRLSADILAFPFAEPDDYIDSRQTDCDTWEDWDSAQADYDGQVSLMIRTTQDNPASGNAAWTDWELFKAGEHVAQGFDFRALLMSSPGQNIGVETMSVLCDLRAKFEEGNDVPYKAKPLDVDFEIRFKLMPSIVIAVQNAAADDKITISNKSPYISDAQRGGFTVEITNAGNPVNRTIDWHAAGY